MKYPYLGIFKSTVNDVSYVVFFISKGTGVIVSSNVVGNESFQVGYFSNSWNETSFEYLDPSISVKLNND